MIALNVMSVLARVCIRATGVLVCEATVKITEHATA